MAPVQRHKAHPVSEAFAGITFWSLSTRRYRYGWAAPLMLLQRPVFFTLLSGMHVKYFFKCLQVSCTLHQRRPIWTCPYNQGGPDSGCCTLPHRGYACQYSSDRYLWLLLVLLLFVQLWRNQNVFTYGLHCHPVSGVAYHSGDSPATATGILAAVHTSFIKLERNVLYTLWFSHCWHMPTGQEYF